MIHHETLIIRCDDSGARCGDVSAWRGDVGNREVIRCDDIGARCGDVGDRAENWQPLATNTDGQLVTGAEFSAIAVLV